MTTPVDPHGSTAVPFQPSAAASSVSFAGRGALGFAVVSVAAFGVWAFGGSWFRGRGGEPALYACIAAVFVLLSGVLLHSLVQGTRRFRRFYFCFVPAFLAYAVIWSGFWFWLKEGWGEWLGASLGSLAFVAITAGFFRQWKGFALATLVFFALHSAGYYAGGQSMAFLIDAARQKPTPFLDAPTLVTLAKLSWGLFYGLGFGAGLGYVFAVAQRAPGVSLSGPGGSVASLVLSAAVIRGLLPCILTVWLIGCASRQAGPSDWKAWQVKRADSIGGTNGWATLVGLHWLPEGAQTVGSASTNDLVISSPSIPASVGVFTRKDLLVSFTASAGAVVEVDGRRVTRLDMVSDAHGKPTRLNLGTLSIIVIERGDRLGLRVRDSEAATRRAFKGLRWFPYDPHWKVEGRFLPFTMPRTLRVPDVTGSSQEFTSPGQLMFLWGGAEYRLDVVEEADTPDYFVLFRDRTSGKATYGAGRFLYVTRPEIDGRVVIDFNRAYTPPCGFTAFALCPLPPRQNWLPLHVRAGELKPTGPHP